MELQVRLQVLRCSRFQGFDETFDYEIEYEGVPLAILNFKVEKKKPIITLVHKVKPFTAKQKKCIKDIEKVILALETANADGSFVDIISYDKRSHQLILTTDNAAYFFYGVLGRKVTQLEKNM